MGLFDKFGKGKKEGQDGENLTANEPQESNAVIEARKAHEGMEWPTIQRINPIKINDVEEYAMEETVDPARKDELGELIYKEEITADDIKELSGQEIIFLLSALEMFNKKAPLPEYEKNFRRVYNEILDRVRNAEYLYVLYDMATGFPFIDNGLGNVYFDEELAKKAVDNFGRQFRKLAVKKCPIEDPNYKEGKKGSFFDYLYYIGIDNLWLDNGAYRVRFKRNEIVAAPGEWNDSQKKIAPINPALNFAMVDFLEEIRWPVKYEKRELIIKAKEARMLSLILKGQFIVPTQHEGPAEVMPDGRVKINPDTKLKFLVMKTKDDNQFLPVYTDAFEFSKVATNKEWNAGVFRYQDIVNFSKDKDGFVINPQGQSVVITKERIMALESANKDNR